ncbi:hypothetical protein HDU98_001346 [Podochytrium sp. JEL0797]|nr:hypothetical protein HDU98_001346 [Podochytrium sp. JEL0797]
MQGSDPSDFFQSDLDIEKILTRELKKKLLEESADKQHKSIITVTSKVLCIELLRNQNEAIVGESGHVARRMDLMAGKHSIVYRGHKGPVTCVQVEYADPNDPNSDRFVYTGSWDKTIKKFDSKTGTLLATFSGHSDFIKTILLVPSLTTGGFALLSGASDNTIRKWDTSTARAIQVWSGHTRPVESLVLEVAESQDVGSAPSLHIYSASSDTSIRKWDLSTGTHLQTLSGHQTTVHSLLLTQQDGDTPELWSTSADKTVKRWNLEDASADSTFEHPDFVKCVVVWGGCVVTGCRDENIRVFDLTTEKCINVIEGHFGEVSSLVIASGRLWSGSLDGTIRSWDLGEILRLNTSAVAANARMMDASKLADVEAAKAAVEKEEAFPVGSGSLLTEEEERELDELMADD